MFKWDWEAPANRNQCFMDETARAVCAKADGVSIIQSADMPHHPVVTVWVGPLAPGRNRGGGRVFQVSANAQRDTYDLESSRDLVPTGGTSAPGRMKCLDELHKHSSESSAPDHHSVRQCETPRSTAPLPEVGGPSHWWTRTKCTLVGTLSRSASIIIKHRLHVEMERSDELRFPMSTR